MNQVEALFWTLRFMLIFFRMIGFILRVLITLSFKLLKVLFLVFAWGAMFPGTRFAK